MFYGTGTRTGELLLGAEDARAPLAALVASHGAQLQQFPFAHVAVPTILLGTLGTQDARAIYGDLPIFDAWKMSKNPVLLMGMDTIGQLDAAVIDHRLRELQLRLRP